MASVLGDAEFAFWKVVAEAHPTATSGDLAFDLVLDLRMHMREAISEWVKLNVPKEVDHA